MKILTTITKKFEGHLSYGEHLRPIRDWMVLCALFAIGFLVSSAWNAWIFYRVVQGESVGTPTTLPVVETSEIEAAQQAFLKRAVEQSKYEGEYHFVDPS